LSRFAYLVSLLPEKVIAELGLDLELRSRPARSYPPAGDDGVLVRRDLDELTALDADLRSFADVVEPTLTEPLPGHASCGPGSIRSCGRRWSSGRSVS